MIDRAQLLRVLGDANVADWVLVERDREVATLDEATKSTRHETRKAWTVIVHVDETTGRGSARVEIDASDERPVDVILDAMAIARATLGPKWASRPPSAPARVSVVDPVLAAAGTIDLGAILAREVAGARRPAEAQVTIRGSLERERVAVDTKAGFHATWIASTIEARALIALDNRSLEVARAARKLSELKLDAALAAAAIDLQMLAKASAPIEGPCALVIGTDAMLHGEGYGIWEIFASFADAALDRQGLSRYRIDTPIAPGADTIGEPLSITSNGAMEFGTLSAPVGDEGTAVRGFTIVDRGIAVGFGLGPREAALRKRDPNGGVRNLGVTLGTWNESHPTGARTIEVRRLRDLSIDRYTGDATLQIALGLEHSAGTSRAFTGGSVRLDLVGALAKARRSSNPIWRGPYYGPAAVLIDAVELA